MNDYRVGRGEAQEDQVTAVIEKSTAKIPSSSHLALAVGAVAVSAVTNKKQASIFVGQGAAPFLLLGIYNKLVKQHGSDVNRESRFTRRVTGGVLRDSRRRIQNRESL